MNNTDKRWNEFNAEPNPGEYKSFRLLNEKNYKLMGQIHLTFTNGERELFETGEFREEAFAKMFDRIDRYHRDLKNTG